MRGAIRLFSPWPKITNMRVGLSALFMVLAAVLPAPGQNVRVFGTYADQSKLLTARSPALTFAPGPPPGSPAFTIAVDSNTTYQQLDGVGASLTVRSEE